MGEESAVFEAIEAGDLARLEALVAGDPSLAGARGEAGLSAVLVAQYRHRWDMVEALLAADPALDVFEAAAVGRADVVRRRLEEEPSRAGAWSPDGFTPLHYAAYFGHVEAARVLLERGADAAAAARNGMAVLPLHSAAAGGSRELCALLLAHGAPVNARQHGGWTPLHGAAGRGDAELVRLFLGHGADPAAASEDGRTPADYAREQGHDAVLPLLQPA